MPLDVQVEMAALETMTLAELRDRYSEVFGEPAYSRHPRHLIRRILWGLQARAEGDLSERTRRRAVELADDAHLRLTPPQPKWTRPAPRRAIGAIPRRALPPGMVLARRYKRKLIEVTVLEYGFAYEGTVFRSLSAVARHVTGSHWNGFHFFGITKNGQRP